MLYDANPQQPSQGTPFLPSRQSRWSLDVRRLLDKAYIKARNHLRDKDKLSLPLDGSAHMHVAGVFKRSPIKERRKIGVILERMRLDRRKADYDDVVLDLNNTTKENLRRAKRVLADLGVL
jgi:ribosomal protein L30/L7E